MSGFQPDYLIMHDYGGTPKNRDGVFNPYNALVFPDGSVRYRNPANPYGEKAPHAFRMNPRSVGLAYAGPVGSRPTDAALEALRREYGRVRETHPNIKPLSHGEAYQKTRGTPLQASRAGRSLDEASGWRTEVLRNAGIVNAAPSQPAASAPSASPPSFGGVGLASSALANTPPPAQPELSAPVPISQRGITSYAGMTDPSPQIANVIPNHLAGSRYDDSTVEGTIPDAPAPQPAQRPMVAAAEPMPAPAPAPSQPRQPLTGRMALGMQGADALMPQQPSPAMGARAASVVQEAPPPPEQKALTAATMPDAGSGVGLEPRSGQAAPRATGKPPGDLEGNAKSQIAEALKTAFGSGGATWVPGSDGYQPVFRSQIEGAPKNMKPLNFMNILGGFR